MTPIAPVSNVEPLKGMKDLHPKLMRDHAYIKTVIDKIATQFSYEEYTLPILESLDTFSHQASTELIAEQSYRFVDKGDRAVILRPEITPVLARMVAKESGSYTLPLRWYTVGNCYRYEKPQTGRLREFAQLNFDLIGKTELSYDFEIMAIIAALMTAFNVPPHAYTLRYNHRTVVDVLLSRNNFTATEKTQFYALIDKKRKLDADAFNDAVNEKFSDPNKQAFIKEYIDAKTLDDLMPTAEIGKENALPPALKQSIEMFREFEANMPTLSLNMQAKFDPTVVRGIDYYTGIVFEVFAEHGKGPGRSLFGGGRYDSLLEKYSSKPLKAGKSLSPNKARSAIGFGMGIHIFSLFLAKNDLLPKDNRHAHTIYLAPLDTEGLCYAFSVATYFHNKKFNTYLGIVHHNIQNHFKKAEQEQCSYMIVLGEKEVLSRKVVMKNLRRSRQDLQQDLQQNSQQNSQQNVAITQTYDIPLS